MEERIMSNALQLDKHGNRLDIDPFIDEPMTQKQWENIVPYKAEPEINTVRAELEAEIEQNKIEHKSRLDKFIEDNTPSPKGTGDITKVWDVPIPSHNDHLNNKDVDYAIYGGLTLFSNYGGIYNTEAQRYIYKNKINDEKEILLDMCNTSESTLKRNLNKLKKIKIKDNLPLVSTENTPNGVVYKLNYAVEDKYYVTIPSDILNYLIKTSNSNMIRLYVFFKVQLANGSKEMQRDYINSYLGYKVGKGNNDALTLMTNDLVAKGLLTKTERVEFFYDEEKGREIPKTLVTYGLNTDSYWREYQKGLTQRL